MKILYLTEWYPHRYDAMYGLFVRRHAAAAVAAGDEVCVIYLHRLTAENLKQSADAGHRCPQYEIQKLTTNGVSEYYSYYRHGYFSALRQVWKEVKHTWGKPDLCQINVVSKDAILPFFLLVVQRIPYMVVEHWSGYLPENNAYMQSDILHRWFTRLVVRHARRLLVVSKELEHGMTKCGVRNKHTYIINNVVDDVFFAQPTPAHSSPQHTTQFVHISCFDEQAKNVRGILNAVRRLADRHTDFHITMVGTGKDIGLCRQYATDLHLGEDIVSWTGELPPATVARELAQADAFVLFSNYETAGVVLSESMAVGTPVITTPVGIASEIIDNQTGIIVPIGDEQQLALSMEEIILGKRSFSREHIRTQALPFTEKAVGETLHKFAQEG